MQANDVHAVVDQGDGNRSSEQQLKKKAPPLIKYILGSPLLLYTAIPETFLRLSV